MRRLLPLLGLLVATSAFAADMPVKAPLLNPIYTGYPYGSSGLFYGIYTEGGGGPVNGSAAGVASARPRRRLSSSAGVGATVGYAWGPRAARSPTRSRAMSATPTSTGLVAGFSMGGPLSVEVRGVAFTPLANFTQYLPNLPSWGTVPPFNALPAGVTASHTQIGLMAGWHWNDVSLDFAGLATGKEFRGAPMVGLVQMEQLSNGMRAADLHQERVFQ